MKSYLKCGSPHAAAFGKAHSPRTGAGRSGSSTTPSFAPTPLCGLFQSSSEQFPRTKRSPTMATVGHASPAHVTVDAVNGGHPPGTGNGGGGGSGGGGGGEPSPEPGTPWWLFCIQAGAAGWAAGCVMFEAGHLLHRPTVPAQRLPPSKKLITAQKAVVQMSHNQLNLSWIWVLLAALSTVAVMLSKRGGNTEHDDTVAEEADGADVVAEEEVADGDVVPSLAHERFGPGADNIHMAAARTQSAPLPDLYMQTFCDSSSFQQLQRFWASGGLPSPVGARSDTDAAQDSTDGTPASQRRPMSLDSCPHAVPVTLQLKDDSCPATSAGLRDQHVWQLSSDADDDSDAMSWPSTPHTPDLKAGPSSDLAALGVDVSHGQQLGAAAPGGVEVSKPPQASRGSEATASPRAPPLLRMRQCEPDEQGLNDGRHAPGHPSMLVEDADQVDEASAESFEMDSYDKFSCASTSTGDAGCIEHMPNLENATATPEQDHIGPQAAVHSAGEPAPAESLGDSTLSSGSASLRDLSPLCCSPEGLKQQDESSAGAAGQIPADHNGSSGEGTRVEEGVAGSQPMHANVEAAVGSGAAAGAACKPDAAENHVQVSSELNLRLLRMTSIPRPILPSGDCSASWQPVAASPLQDVMSGYSFVRGGLDTTSSTVFPHNSWQIPDDVEVQPSKLPPRPTSVFSSDGSADSGPRQLPDAGPLRHRSGQSNGSVESYGSSGSPSFMSFPTEQNQVHILHWT